MLREVTGVKQKTGEPRRRWFSSESMDLFIWFSDSNEVLGYQLAYNKPYAEKALTWRVGEGFTHLSVDDGSRPGRYPASPLLKADGEFDAMNVLAKFKAASAELEPSLEEFIVSGIERIFK